MGLSQFSKGIGYMDKKVFIDLYKTYVRPNLEFLTSSVQLLSGAHCIFAHTIYEITNWSPWTVGDKVILEAVQGRVVKAVSNLRVEHLDTYKKGGLAITVLQGDT